MLFDEYTMNKVIEKTVFVPLIFIITPVYVLHLFSISAFRNLQACIVDNAVSNR